MEDANAKRWFILRARIAEENVKTAFSLFRAEGIEPILIKGWAAAREYPEKYQRIFSDLDFCVAPEDYEKGTRLLAAEAAKSLNIDLHCGLRHLDTAEWETLFHESVMVSLDGQPIRVLRPEDHLRVLCVHWLTDGGAYREKLLDIYYLLQNNLENFDWKHCFARIDEKRRDWIIKTLAVVHREYRLNTSKIPFGNDLNSIPEWFLKELEREWKSETKLQDISALWGNREEFWRQLKKRFRPNAIQATILMEGRLDQSSRLYYQLGSFLLRMKISLKKNFALMKTLTAGKIKKNA